MSNPYSSSPYSSTEKTTLTHRQLEANALIKTASELNRVRQNWDDKKDELNNALELNRRLWTVLVGNINDDDHPLPVELKQNIANLAYFIFKRTIDVMTNPKPESLDVLININMNLAKGLNGSPND